ncbi:unnamed protein product [Spirodela intermedia]|uniref:NAD-dependent epimerase/dehydratase domain-containing protein n=1 Tax=Spirodela intermedia TaxID=51605 RepID=A0A7I8IPQ2_SPIIN|nr:unnamed protein product [Spirodela intermedia]CAA6659878.1 unnamed protein product [Spirodela intermedia]
MGFPPDTSKTVKLERYNSYLRRVNSTKLLAASSKLIFRSTLLAALILVLFLTVNYPPLSSSHSSSGVPYASHRSLLSSSLYSGGGAAVGVLDGAPAGGMSVLVTGAAGFVGTHCSLALKKRGDGVLGLDNFNAYYDPSLKRAGDINDAALLAKLFDVVPFTHVLHLAAQAGVRYAMRNPQSYIQSNIAGFVTLLEAAAKRADPQPAIVWASSSSVYGLNEANPFSESHRTDRPASLYAATKKAGEEIAHVYNHIYGLSLTGLRFFTVYGPWGRPDMAYFFFTKDILQGKQITVFKPADGEREVARDFTFIDDVVKGCLGALDTAEKSTGMPGGGRSAGRRSSGCTTSATPRRLAHGDFGYQPTTDLATGLRKFVKWYVDYHGIKIPVSSATTASSSSSSSSSTSETQRVAGDAADDTEDSSLSAAT